MVRKQNDVAMRSAFRRLAFATLVTTTLASTTLVGCLPGDERPEPGTLQINVKSSSATTGFETDDGWTITFQRFVSGLANTGLTGEQCNDYSSTRYDRLFDFSVAGDSKVGLHYALGDCKVGMTLGIPSSQALLMAGATQADLDWMSVGVIDFSAPPSGQDFSTAVGLLLRAQATRGAATKHMAWALRRSHGMNNCVDSEGAVINRYAMDGGEHQEHNVEVHPQELFRIGAFDAPILFEPFAEADVNQDDDVSLQELTEVQLPVEVFGDAFPEELGEAATLGLLLQEVLFARVLRFEGAEKCDRGATEFL